MEFLSTRKWYTDKSTIAELTIADNLSFLQYILEPTVRVGKDPRGIVAIPEGRYELTMYDSPKHGRVPLLNGVPDHTFVEIHPGNFPCDTLDCQLPGLEMGLDDVLDSKEAFDILVPIIEKALNTEQVWYTIKNTGC